MQASHVFPGPCVVQIIQDFKEDTMHKPKAKQAIQDPNDDTKGVPQPPPESKQGGDFVLDVKQRQIALTNAGLNRAFSRLCKLLMHLYNQTQSPTTRYNQTPSDTLRYSLHAVTTSVHATCTHFFGCQILVCHEPIVGMSLDRS